MSRIRSLSLALAFMDLALFNALRHPRRARRWALMAVDQAVKSGNPDVAYTANYIAGVCS